MTSTSSPQIVLVVDDEEGIRLLERRVLEKDGYIERQRKFAGEVACVDGHFAFGAVGF